MYKFYLIFIEKLNGFCKVKFMLIFLKMVINVDEILIYF